MKPSVIVVGSVDSTAQTIKSLAKHGFPILGVLGYEVSDTEAISGWVNLRDLANELEVPFRPYEKVNDQCHIDWARSHSPDIVFAVGFSQLLAKKWLMLPRLGCIGFHPTLLPRGRGRAPIAWIILEERIGAASFFLMSESADDGPLFVQEPFVVGPDDDAFSLSRKIRFSIELALDRWLPQLADGVWDPKPQEQQYATYFGVRKPEDGNIDWKASAIDIDRLIKATCRPHPGAYTYWKRQRVLVQRSEVETALTMRGVVGRVLLARGQRVLVQCGSGLLWIDGLEPCLPLRVGEKMGMCVEDEIVALWKQVEACGDK